MTPEDTVREARDVLVEACWTPDAVAEWDAALAALVAERDALAARLAEAERLAATREQQVAMIKRHMGERCQHLTERAVAAEARVAALTEALRSHFQLDDKGRPAKWMYHDDFERIVAAADRPEGTTPLDEARAVYEAMARLFTSEGCRRQERGSGWWWSEGLDEEATVGGAVEQVLANYGIDTREPFPWETEFGWEATPQEGNA